MYRSDGSKLAVALVLILQPRFSRLKVAAVVEPLSDEEESLAGFRTCSVAVTKSTPSFILSFSKASSHLGGQLGMKEANLYQAHVCVTSWRCKNGAASATNRCMQRGTCRKKMSYRGTSIIACSRVKRAALRGKRTQTFRSDRDSKRAHTHTQNGSRSGIEVVTSSVASFGFLLRSFFCACTWKQCRARAFFFFTCSNQRWRLCWRRRQRQRRRAKPFKPKSRTRISREVWRRAEEQVKRSAMRWRGHIAFSVRPPRHGS